MSPTSNLAPHQQKIHHLLQNNFAYFAPRALKIQDKSGALVPFTFNKAQEYIHARVEDQKKRTGRVRMLLLKGRQQGGSTYIGGRFFFKATRSKGKNVFILSHEAQTTEKLFKMVERYQNNCPPALQPRTDVHNRRMLTFAGIDSSYTVGTAGNDDVGRGGTVQFFHGSEVAFWGNTEGIETGIMQSIADLPDTEVFLESTANGMVGMFYEKVMQALEGKGEYELIFVPWFWQTEYSKTPPPDFRITEDEIHLKNTYGLTDAQVYWRRLKVIELRSEWKFKQEYPCNPMEAFQTSGEGFFDPEKIEEAMTRTVDNRNSLAPRIGAMDPAGKSGKDAATIGHRHGAVFEGYIKYEVGEKDSMELVYQADAYIKKHRLDWFFIDNGYGEAIVSRLHEMNPHYKKMVIGIWFAGSPINKDKYANKRAEMMDATRKWLYGEDGPVQIPNDEAVRRDFMVLPKERHTSNGKMIIESKENLPFSPNILDMIGLTHAFPVKSNNRNGQIRKATSEIKKKNQSPLITIRKTGRTQREALSLSAKVALF